jgi:hypothetical protein
VDGTIEGNEVFHRSANAQGRLPEPVCPLSICCCLAAPAGIRKTILPPRVPGLGGGLGDTCCCGRGVCPSASARLARSAVAASVSIHPVCQVPAALVADVADAVRGSELLSVSEDGTKVRRTQVRQKSTGTSRVGPV